MCVFSALDTNLPWGRRVCRPLRAPSLLLSLAHSFPFPAVFHLDLVGWNRTLIGHAMPEWLCVSDRVYALSATIQATILKQYGRGSANKTSLSTGRSNMQDQLFGHLSSPDPLLFKFWSVVLQMEIYTSLNKKKQKTCCSVQSTAQSGQMLQNVYFILTNWNLAVKLELDLTLMVWRWIAKWLAATTQQLQEGKTDLKLTQSDSI